MQLISPVRAIPLRRKLGGVIILAALAGWIVLNLASLTSYPTPQPDDTFFGVVAVQFLNHGQFGNPLYEDMSGSQESLFHLGRIYIVLVAIVFKLFGVGLYQGRLLVLIGHWVSGVSLFFIGKKLWGPVEGVAAALILITSWYAFWSAHTLRPDAWVNAAGLACLLLVLRLKESPSPKSGFVVGLAAVLILDVHLKALHYTVATLGMATLLTLPKSQTRRTFFAMVVGMAAGALYWVGLHIVPDPQLALAQLQTGPNAYQLTPRADLLFLVQGTLRVLSIIFQSTRFGWFECIYMVGGAIALAASRQPADRWSVSYILLYVFSFTFLMPVKSLYHIFLLLPLISLLTARGISLLAAALTARFGPQRNERSVFALLILSPLILLYMIGDAKLAWENRVISYENYSKQLLAHVPANANVLGETTWWWAFREGFFSSDQDFTRGIKASDGQTRVDGFFDQAFANRRVEYVFLDDAFGVWKGSREYKPDLHVMFADYLLRRCQQVGIVHDYFYGVDMGALDIKETVIYHCLPAN